MFDKEFWNENLQSLDEKELKEVQKLVNKYLKSVDKREEFSEVLRRFAQKYPNARYFCTGSAGKGAYESEGEWYTNNWNELWNVKDVWDELVDTDEDEERGDVEILSQFETTEDWENALLNEYVKGDKEFKKAFDNSKHKPKWSVSDAEDLYNGETIYEFIDIKTGESKYLYTSQY